MKKNVFIKTIIASLILLTCFSSCDNMNKSLEQNPDKEGLAYIKINVDDSAARTAVPNFTTDSTADSIKGYAFVLKGKKDDAALWQTLGTYDSDSDNLASLQNASFALSTGSWIFELTATYYDTVLKGSTEEYNIEAGLNSINIKLKLDTENLTGAGSLSVALDFSAAENKNAVKKVTAQVYTYDISTGTETANTTNYPESALTYTQNSGTATLTQSSLPAGYYNIKFRLYADEDYQVLINTIPEMALITDSKQSTSTVELNSLNQVYTITYNNIAGINETISSTQVFTKNCSTITLPEITKTGYIFGGWYQTADFSDEAVTTLPAGSTGNKTYYAKLTPNYQGFDANINPGSSVLSVVAKVDGVAVEEGQTITAKYNATAGKSIVFTPTFTESGYTCTWTVDSTEQIANVDANNVLTVDTTGWVPGIYDVFLTATKTSGSDTLYESYYAQIKVEALGSKLHPNAVGDIVFNDGSAVAYTEGMTLTDEQKAAAVAVIFYKGTECSNDSRQRILGLGLKNSNGDSTKTYNWAKEGTFNDSTNFTNNVIAVSEQEPTEGIAFYQATGNGTTYYLTRDFDGSDNWSNMCSKDTEGTASSVVAQNYPAFNYVNNYAANIGLTGTYAEGWYMPTAVELHCIYKNKTLLNTILESLNYADTLDSDKYWSSSQFSRDYYYAWFVNFNNGEILSEGKNDYKRVCVIREF